MVVDLGEQVAKSPHLPVPESPTESHGTFLHHPKKLTATMRSAQNPSIPDRSKQEKPSLQDLEAERPELQVTPARAELTAELASVGPQGNDDVGDCSGIKGHLGAQGLRLSAERSYHWSMGDGFLL